MQTRAVSPGTVYLTDSASALLSVAGMKQDWKISMSDGRKVGDAK